MCFHRGIRSSARSQLSLKIIRRFSFYLPVSGVTVTKDHRFMLKVPKHHSVLGFQMYDVSTLALSLGNIGQTAVGSARCLIFKKGLLKALVKTLSLMVFISQRLRWHDVSTFSFLLTLSYWSLHIRLLVPPPFFWIGEFHWARCLTLRRCKRSHLRGWTLQCGYCLHALFAFLFPWSEGPHNGK